MGTRFEEMMGGCFARAMPGEVMFVLLARDPHTPDLISKWADNRELEIERGERPESDRAQVVEARLTIERAKAWRLENDGKWREPHDAPRVVELLDTLMRIGAYDDTRANEKLATTGSYSGFDEPNAVRLAREAIDAVAGPPPVRA